MADKTGLEAQDVKILRALGEWQAAAAESSANKEKIRAWLAHDAGSPERRVMVMAETGYLQGERVAVGPGDLKCQDKWARSLEWTLRLRQFEADSMKDDHIVSSFIEHSPSIHIGDFGIPSGKHYEEGAAKHAFNYQPPLKALDNADFARLKSRTLRWDREEDMRTRERLEAIFDGILPVRRRNGPWFPRLPITSIVLDMVGLDNFMLLIYDNPEGLRRLAAFISDEHLAFVDWCEAEGILTLNNEGDIVGSGSVGFTKDLPKPDFSGKARACDLWLLCESQESVGIGPEQYREFVFPHLRALAERFGKIYYGCCEPADPILDCLAELPNLARVSVSPWADEAKMADFCRKRGVAYSRKPRPNFFGEEKFNEAAVLEHLKKTVHRAHGCRLEIIQRDVYVTNNQPERFVRWVELAREAAKDFRP